MILPIPLHNIPIHKILVDKNVELFMKREDLVHPQISGNKYWKLFYNFNKVLQQKIENPLIITFGGAYSNHISAVSYAGKVSGVKTLGIIRGEELENSWKQNPTLCFASENGMDFKFVTREEYRNKEVLAENLRQEYPNSILIPEGGTNKDAVKGVKMMLNEDTKDFDYLCTAVGTGGTIAGISEYCNENQKVIGFTVVNDSSLEETILNLTSQRNFILKDASFGGYGKISDETVSFINQFKTENNIPLEPIYTGKMMQRVFEMIAQDEFPAGSKILCFHTGGLQGIEGANLLLKKQNKQLII